MSGGVLAKAPRGARGTARRGWQWGLVATATALTGLGITTTAGAAPSHPGVPTSVIVRAASGQLRDAEDAVTATGGHVGRDLAIINGFAAVVPADTVATIEQTPSVLAVTADTSLQPMSVDPSLGYDATGNLGSMSSVTRMIGAQDLWAAGYTGKGVDVALIDTGVAPVPGIDDHIVNGPDLSFDYQTGAPASVDAYGHGTHMAGIIAGRDAGASASSAGCTTCLNSSGYSDTTKFVGVAPDARIVNVKVGAFNGAADVSQVIAGIDWVVQHRNDNGLNIRVLNLSFGTDSQQPYTIDPLAYAAEVAWRHGIVVVAAAGNEGRGATSLNDPAYDPTILAVGAADPNGSTDPRDSVVAGFSSKGSDDRPVDVVAPGVHIIGLRDPGSFVDDQFPTSQVGDRFTLGSGTSQAAAVTSGFVADLVQRFPDASPDQIKALVTKSARDLRHGGNRDDGNRILDGGRALSKEKPPKRLQNFEPASGTGSLEAARGTYHVVAGDSVLSGEQDIFGNAWDGRRWSIASWNGTSWNSGLWKRQRWSGEPWNGLDWTNGSWDGTGGSAQPVLRTRIAVSSSGVRASSLVKSYSFSRLAYRCATTAYPRYAA